MFVISCSLARIALSVPDMSTNTQLNNKPDKRGQKSTVSLAEWVTLPGKRVSARAAFLPVRDEVLRAVMLGYDLRTIYAWLHDTGRYPCSYQSFRCTVRRAQHELRNAEPSPTTAPPTKPAPGIGGFSLSQMSKEELL